MANWGINGNPVKTRGLHKDDFSEIYGCEQKLELADKEGIKNLPFLVGNPNINVLAGCIEAF